ncbi:hypothetical protein [Mesotoga sp. UBA5847]|uniref:hypothetical protein n=1 Tax=Mesotoga sp. UBA5847 TaxID=1946859 RepID=UPI0025D3DB85|nr:hypothetical protein [Mesotoga sp. UBA5847]
MSKRSGGSSSRSSGGSSSSSRSSGGRSGGSLSSSRSGGSTRSSSSSSSGGSTPSRTSNKKPSIGLGGSSGKRISAFPFRVPTSGVRRPVSTSSGSSAAAGCAGCGGCSGIGFGVIIVAVVLVILVSSGAFSSCGRTNTNVEITRSTIAREPLPKGSVNETPYYTDELGWINNQTTLLDEMRYFYQKTGVQPYLFITDTVNGSHFPRVEDLAAFAESLYDDLFTDEAHCLLVFFEYGDAYMDRYVCGSQAKTVIDDEAADILLDYIDKYYYYEGLSDEEFFSKAFRDAADRIMTVTRSPWIPVFIIIGIIALIALLLFWWSNVKKQKNIEAKRTQEILNTPLETFGDKEVDDLAKKYQEDKES